ncbi:MAG: HAMP domain-containing histidine kinase [Myxococcales bacterium]|nr:HAMP domain-containing histidine kinase [Myxococcales bacterium]
MSPAPLSAQQLAAVADRVQLALLVVQPVDPEDADSWLLRFVNQAAIGAAERDDRAGLAGRRFLEVFPAARGSALLDGCRDVLRSGRACEVREIVLGDGDAPRAAYRVSLAPLPGGCVLAQYLDVTAQRRAEDELRALTADLEGQVAARTAELEASRTVIREIAHAAAHDLQTPLRHVVGFAEFALDALEPDAPARDNVERARAAALRMKTRIDALLEFTDERRVNQEVFAVAPLVEGVRRDLLDLAGGARVHVDLRVERVRTSREHLRTLLRELLANALTFTRPGEPADVRLSLRPRGDEVVLEVADRGVGIRTEEQAQVFQAFHRLQPDPDGHAAGVGLALCRRAVEACGGTLAVRSTPGEGATFVATLPAQVEPPVEHGLR